MEATPKLTIFDIILKHTLLKLIPKSVKPNNITVVRFLLIPIVVWFVLIERYDWGIIVFLLAALTDALDGSMARTRNQITDWGKVYDPVADKLLIGSLVLAIVIQYLNLYLALTVIAVEMIFIIGAWYRHSKGRVVQADIWGKIKMNFQVVGILILLLALYFNFGILFPLSAGAFYVSIIFAVVSLFSHGI